MCSLVTHPFALGCDQLHSVPFLWPMILFSFQETMIQFHSTSTAERAGATSGNGHAWDYQETQGQAHFIHPTYSVQKRSNLSRSVPNWAKNTGKRWLSKEDLHRNYRLTNSNSDTKDVNGFFKKIIYIQKIGSWQRVTYLCYSKRDEALECIWKCILSHYMVANNYFNHRSFFDKW